jgi:predicted alpha/beta superfamily hydrolase
MKRKVAGAGGAVLVVALLAIAGWYVVHTQATQAELNRAVADYELRKQPVSVTFTVTAPPNTPKDQDLYISGSVPALGNWDAPGVRLTKGDDGKYHATVPDLLSNMDYTFKVTRGTWSTVETDKDGKDILNRSFTSSKDGKVEVAVAGWIDNGKAVPGRTTITGDVRLHKNALRSDILGNARSLVVYVPPGYEQNKDKRYPVLYLNDGQNLFDEATSYQGVEWGLDETAQRLIGAGQIKPLIIVGVYNSEQRTAEFTPPFSFVSKNDAAKGDQYAKMIVDQAKRFVDERYRTLSDRANTMIGGGSMGGLIALYTARTHNDVFGGVIALSPWLRIGNQSIAKELIGDGAWLKNSHAYIDMGTDPGHNYAGGADGKTAIADADQLVAELEKAGLTQGKQFVYRTIEGGKHNESSWSETAEQVLLAVYGMNAAAPTPTTAP